MLNHWLGKLGLAIAGLVVLTYLGLCAAIWKWQNTLIFLPGTATTVTPAARGLDAEEVWLTVGGDEQERLHGWWLPAAQPAQGTLLLLHGNRGNLEAILGQAEIFHQLHFNVFLFSYRGYGHSQGRNFPHEQQVYEDAATALEYLTTTRGLDPAEIVVFGHSLGGAIAIDLATRHPDLAALIVQSSFTNMAAMVAHDGLYSQFFPVNLLLHQRFDSLAKLPQLNLPLLFIHGSQDNRIPDQMSRELYAAAQGLKRFYLVPGADHNNVATVGGAGYQTAIAEFWQQVRDRQVQLAPR